MKKSRFITFGVLIIFIFAWIIGSLKTEKQIYDYLRKIIPEADSFQSDSDGIITAYLDPGEKSSLYYISTGAALGYGGKLIVLVVATPEGLLHKVFPMSIRESPAFYTKVKKKGFLKKMEGKHLSSPFVLNQDLDGISGATVTCTALAKAIRQARGSIAKNRLSLDIPADPAPRFRWGWAETFLLLFFSVGFIARMKKFPFTKGFRWLSMLGGLLVLGFIFNIPLTMAYINKLLLGFWPLFQEHLYFYILVGGVILFTIFSGQNPYCQWFCPFGAAQECIHIIGGGKLRFHPKVHRTLKFLQGIIAMGLIITALVTRHPARGSHEVYGVFFRLTGSVFLFLLLGIVLIGSLMMKRPWCLYLCPMRPVSDYLRKIHQISRGYFHKNAKNE